MEFIQIILHFPHTHKIRLRNETKVTSMELVWDRKNEYIPVHITKMYNHSTIYEDDFQEAQRN